MRILDLFCGAGGASMGYHLAFPDADIIGVDNRPMPRYPFTFWQADAMTFPLDGFDLVHASPPCQAFSTMKVMPNAREHGDLLTPTRERLIASGIPYVIENVVGAPMDAGPPSLFASGGVTLCGSMFGLDDGIFELRRHRLFETSAPVTQPKCNHRLPVVGFYGDHARSRQRTVIGNRDRGGDITGLDRKMPLVRDLLGIDWMSWSEATQAIPPAYTEFIGHQFAALAIFGVPTLAACYEHLPVLPRDAVNTGETLRDDTCRPWEIWATDRMRYAVIAGTRRIINGVSVR